MCVLWDVLCVYLNFVDFWILFYMVKKKVLLWDEDNNENGNIKI